MELEIKITNFLVEIKPVVRSDNIKAFVTWIFQTELGVWKVYGGTIRLKPFGKNNKMLLSYDPPAFGPRFTKALFIEDKGTYIKLCDYTIKSYCTLTGEINNNILMDEGIDPDEVPIK